MPSATVEIRAGGQSVERVRWGDLLERGRVETARARIELIVPARNWVETVVLDDATGQPVPCRVHFRSPEGVPYQPHGHHGTAVADQVREPGPDRRVEPGQPPETDVHQLGQQG